MSIFEEKELRYTVSVQVEDRERLKELMEFLQGRFSYQVKYNNERNSIDELFKEIKMSIED